MTNAIVPTIKTGTSYQSPSWRYQATLEPERFGLKPICSRTDRVTNCGFLKRLIPKGIAPNSTYYLPVYFKRIINDLPQHLAELLIKTWNKYYFTTRERKINFSPVVMQIVPVSFNLTKVHKLNDDFLRRLILHSINYQYDENIEQAIRFYLDKTNGEVKDWFRYAVYCGYTDAKLAKQWKMSVGTVHALRLAFFDYTHWPKDRLAQFALLRNLQANKEMTEADFHVHKRILDLGDAGLRSIFDQHNLTEEERCSIDLYLKSCPASELLSLKYAVRTSRDAHAFNRAVLDYGMVDIRQKQLQLQGEMLRLTSAKLSKEMGVSEHAQVFVEDTELMRELEEGKRFDHIPEFPSFIDVIATPVEPEKLLVEKSS
jgi:hypothetical protein